MTAKELRASRTKRVPQVALLIETSRGYGRGVIDGIYHYQFEHGPWLLSFRPQGTQESVPSWLRRWQGDGVVARIDNRRIVSALERIGAPVVDISASIEELGYPVVSSDPKLTMSLILDHLLEVGIRDFAFYGGAVGADAYLDLRRDVFASLARDKGFDCKHGFQPREFRQSWSEGFTKLIGWVRSLPKPIGIVGANDDAAREIIEVCRHAGIDVPNQVAVAGCSNDEYLCRLSHPQLTSVDINPFAIGYAAAQKLDRLMHGKSCSQQPLYVPPVGIVIRESTEMVYGLDELTTSTLNFIRDHACQGINVADVARHLDVSRRSLERHYRLKLGRSPKQEILRQQLDSARRLLRDTSLRVEEIAARCGFNSLRNFLAAFKRRFGATPTQVRLQGLPTTGH